MHAHNRVRVEGNATVIGTIRAEGRVSDSAAKQIIQAMVKIDPELSGGYQIVSWQDQYY